MNKIVTFRHLTGSMKLIPGVKSMDLSPKIKAGVGRNPEVRRRIQGFDVGTYPTLEMDRNYTPQVVLLDEDFEPLSPEEKAYPPAMRKRLEQEHAEDAITRRNANKTVMSALTRFVQQGEIEIIDIKEMTPNEVMQTKAPIVSLSTIAIADYENRGIPIPPELMGNSIDTERLRAQAALNKS